jgi:hypothetical protein
VSNELTRSVPLAVLFVAGLAAGVWIFVAPWTVGYPMPHGWTASVWTSVWVGAALVTGSSVSLVAVVAHAVRVSVRQGRRGRSGRPWSGARC